MIKNDVQNAQSTPRILIMEDNLDLLRLFSKALKNAGYDVDTATTLEDARARLLNAHFNLLLCDIHIGERRGTDLLREQIENLHAKGTEVVVVSVDTHYRPLCQDLGIDFYLEKPVSVRQLVQIIKRLLPLELKDSAALAP
jgi:two-component system response regulator PilR (NtrC family)